LADINVERRGPTVWAWIIGLVILVLLIWAIAEIVDRQEKPAREVIEVVPQPGTAAPATGAVPDTGR
jgi:Na+-transporting methylmalonyl-CoA/oxaloacetate decarboxylase gamma subunit